ncbi:J domain-containing protein [Anaeromyxobacter terrae]|uniref:J domain-containing protein n=1 Tax=Anaeromyxobacter terrae TaxID=2925406 RepID=UPI001F5765C8|nr:tetratricopeptide repeat protein [Anaeromyxobacter sp. SG22]
MSSDKYSGFQFAPAELGEDVELDLDRRKDVLFAAAHADRWTHWEALGLPWNASVEAARAAYLGKVKLFHPDRYAGRRLGSYQGRLERVFRRITEARDVLADEGRRAAYARETAPPEVRAQLEARRLEDERRASERRARLVRQNPIVGRASRVGELVARAKDALAEGRLREASNDLRLALDLDPRHPEAVRLAPEARRRAAGQRAAELVHEGATAEATGRPGAALAAYREALAVEPGNVRAAAAGARAALAAGDVAAARTLADAAVRAGPQAAIAHEALGMVLDAQGERKEARRALERALELDPGRASAKERLKGLRWSFLG